MTETQQTNQQIFALKITSRVKDTLFLTTAIDQCFYERIPVIESCQCFPSILLIGGDWLVSNIFKN